MPNNDRGTRFPHTGGSGGNEPKRRERTEQSPDRDPRQGGDLTRDDHLEPPIQPEEREKVR